MTTNAAYLLQFFFYSLLLLVAIVSLTYCAVLKEMQSSVVVRRLIVRKDKQLRGKADTQFIVK